MANVKLKFKSGSTEFEAEGDEAFVQRMIERFAPADQTRTSNPLVKATPDDARETKEMSPAEFLRSKNPKTGTETLLVLGRYLETHKEMKSFKAADIKSIADEGRITPPHSQYFTYAVQQGYFRSLSKGTYALTLSGEDLVQAMPAPK